MGHTLKIDGKMDFQRMPHGAKSVFALIKKKLYYFFNKKLQVSNALAALTNAL
jgi:hypothetical protein